MFAYCNNCPVSNHDSNGKMVQALSPDPMYSQIQDGCGSGGAGIIAVGAVVGAIAYGITYAVHSVVREIIEYSHFLADDSSGQYANNQPRIHHIIPKGDFSKYGSTTMMQLDTMHVMLRTAGIDINDPENLVILSHGSHKTLHTKEYINGIYQIMMTADSMSYDDVRVALFWARIYATSWDQYPIGKYE